MSVNVHHGNVFKQIINERISSNFVIVNDTVEFSGLPLIKLFVENHASKGNIVHFLWCEYHREPDYLEKLSQEYPSSVKVYNIFSDPLNWFRSKDGGQPLSLDSIASSLISGTEDESKRNVVILDSPLYPFEITDLTSICRTFNKLLNHHHSPNGPSRIQIILVLHADIFDSETPTYRQLNHMATTQITVEGHLSKEKTGKIMVRHRSLKGKTLKEAYTAWLGASGCFSYEEFKPVNKESKSPPNKNVSDMELTTFRLSLREEEIESRKKVPLPYLRKNQPEQKGRIFYEPDENDDWDDEDPDDDLEI